MARKPSDLTVTDLFCGAGGSSLGASQAGGRLRMALNHWDLAIETHNSNFPDADHDCTDISATDPRRYPSTQILIASPECTNHSLAKGKKRKVHSLELFAGPADDPTEIRSRATMWDVPRFAEFHGYDVVIVENVVDARRWVMYEAWLHAMACLGYEHRAVYLNSMFAHPTPQSRDRMYVVFWKRGNRAPDLTFEPAAWCPRCEASIESVQSWKTGRSWGRYGQQYVYLCPRCAGEVSPYYYAALNAIDFSVPATRIGDRARPLRERTLERIRYGLEKYGRDPLLVVTNMTTEAGRVRSAVQEPGFTQTASWITALVSPWLVNTRQLTGLGHRVRGADGPIPTQTASLDFGVAFPFLVDTGRSDAPEHRTRELDRVLPTQTSQRTHGVVLPAGFVAHLRGTAADQLRGARGLDDVLGAITAGGIHHALVQGSALLTLRDHPRMLLNELSDALPTQVAAGPHTAVIGRTPFLATYMGQSEAHGLDGAMPTVVGKDREALVEPGPELSVDDCYFRMLQPHEIQAGMAFPQDYRVLGTKTNQVKQLGNAVTPPVMRELMRRAIDSLEGGRAA